MATVAKKGWDQYMLQLQRHPLRTKAITAGVLAGVSDSVAQKLSGIQRLQLRRLLLKVLLGFAYGGPFGHFLHKLLDVIFKGKKDTKTVAKKVGIKYGYYKKGAVLQGNNIDTFGKELNGPFKITSEIDFSFVDNGQWKHVFHNPASSLRTVLLEQVTSSPWNNLLFLLYYGFIVEGRPWPQVKNKIKKDYPSVQLTSWMFWPIVGWINHQYMPLQFRVIFHSFVACCWGIFLNLRARTMALAK